VLFEDSHRSDALFTSRVYDKVKMVVRPFLWFLFVITIFLTLAAMILDQIKQERVTAAVGVQLKRK